MHSMKICAIWGGANSDLRRGKYAGNGLRRLAGAIAIMAAVMMFGAAGYSAALPEAPRRGSLAATSLPVHGQQVPTAASDNKSRQYRALDKALQILYDEIMGHGGER